MISPLLSFFLKHTRRFGRFTNSRWLLVSQLLWSGVIFIILSEFVSIIYQHVSLSDISLIFGYLMLIPKFHHDLVPKIHFEKPHPVFGFKKPAWMPGWKLLPKERRSCWSNALEMLGQLPQRELFPGWFRGVSWGGLLGCRVYQTDAREKGKPIKICQLMSKMSRYDKRQGKLSRKSWNILGQFQ